jgi:hypothetical protein
MDMTEEELKTIIENWNNQFATIQKEKEYYQKLFNITADKLEIAEDIIFYNSLDDEYDERIRELLKDYEE